MKALKTHNALGKILCATGGAIIGFVLGGPLFAVLGTIPGFGLATLVERFVVNSAI